MARKEVKIPILDAETGAETGVAMSLWVSRAPSSDLSIGGGGDAPDYKELSPEEADEHGEYRWQIVEGRFYEYRIEKPEWQLSTKDREQMIRWSSASPGSGTIATGNYVGRLRCEVVGAKDGEKADAGKADVKGFVELEVQSAKMDYRTHYRTMLRDISERAAELVMAQSRTVEQTYDPDPISRARTLYERFAFVKALVAGEGFRQAVARILAAPLTGTEEEESEVSIHRAGRFSAAMLRQFATSRRRTEISSGSPLRARFPSVPERLRCSASRETVDIPENRFVKYALRSFRDFATEVENHPDAKDELKREARRFGEEMEEILSDPFFRDVSELRRIPLSSPALQRREGYREILRGWIFFDAAASLAWKGGDDVYEGGKRNIAQLYEYWLFFKTLGWVREAFRLNKGNVIDDNLLENNAEGGLTLRLRRGCHCYVDEVCESEGRTIHIKFSYNRFFRRSDSQDEAGSWTIPMQPDYTLSLWPESLKSDKQAEKEGLAVHLHFDAKYRKKTIRELLGDDDEGVSDDETTIERLAEERKEEDRGEYKRADLLKMHAYNEAVRRSYGSYVLYPGDKDCQRKRFHEIIPGLGAFCVRPPERDGDDADGANAFIKFLRDIRHELLDRMTQRERAAIHRKIIYGKPPRDLSDKITETPLPDFDGGEPVIPSETPILVGSYRPEQLEWIRTKMLYNFRLVAKHSAIAITADVLKARYLLLHPATKNPPPTSDLLFRLSQTQPPVFAAPEDLKKKGYPLKPSKSAYCVFHIEEVEPELKGMSFNLEKLGVPKYVPGDKNLKRNLPITDKTLADLLAAQVI